MTHHYDQPGFIFFFNQTSNEIPGNYLNVVVINLS